MLISFKKKIVIKNLNIIQNFSLVCNELVNIMKKMIFHAQYKDIVFLHEFALVLGVHCDLQQGPNE